MKALPTNRSLVLYASMFIIGGAGLAYEYTLSKLSSDLLGNSVKQWALIIGIMMFFMGVGSDLQKYIKEEGILDKFVIIELLLALCGSFGPIAILWAYGSFHSHFTLVQYFFIAAIGLFIGLELPLLIRINQSYVDELRFNIGAMFKMDYMGALCGALLWAFLLPKYFTIIETGFVLGSLSLAAAILALWYFRKQLRNLTLCCLLALASLSLIITGLICSNQWAHYAEQRLYPDRIILAKTSQYQHIVVTQSPKGAISLYLNGHLQFNSRDEHIYHESLVHPAMALKPEATRVLILGGGDGLAAREVLKYKGVKELVLCDLDPAITHLARTNKYFIKLNQASLVNSRVIVLKNRALLPSWLQRAQVSTNPLSEAALKREKVAIINIDALKFIEEIPGRYDVIILDFPDPSTPELTRLYSRWFYTLLHKRLANGGLIVQQATSVSFTPEAYRSIGSTIKAAGFAAVGYHAFVPSFASSWGFWLFGSQNFYSAKILKDKLTIPPELRVRTKYLSPDLIRAATVFGKDFFAKKANNINTLSSARLYDYYVKGWQEAR